jgi:hypothetical protein
MGFTLQSFVPLAAAVRRLQRPSPRAVVPTSPNPAACCDKLPSTEVTDNLRDTSNEVGASTPGFRVLLRGRVRHHGRTG